MKLIKDIYNSFFNNDNGFSARKLTAFAGFCTAFKLSWSLEGEDRLHAVYAFLATGLLCLGIVTIQNIIDFKNGKQPSNEQPQ